MLDKEEYWKRRHNTVKVKVHNKKSGKIESVVVKKPLRGQTTIKPEPTVDHNPKSRAAARREGYRNYGDKQLKESWK